LTGDTLRHTKVSVTKGEVNKKKCEIKEKRTHKQKSVSLSLSLSP